jgi:hypothetical protein
MYLYRADLNNNTSYENVSKPNLQFIYFAFFTFSLWDCSSETNYVVYDYLHTVRFGHTRTEHATQRNWNIYIWKSMHVMFYMKKCSFHVLPQTAALYSKICILKAM